VNTPKGRLWFDEASGNLVRPYTITRGRTGDDRTDFTLITLVRSAEPAGSSRRRAEQPETAAILEHCQERPMAIAEIAAHLDLPPSVVKVLCGDLLDRSMISVKVPGAEAGAPSVELLERVIRGVQRKL
jgi:hypothetical protein